MSQTRAVRRVRLRDLAGAFLVVAESILVFLGWFESTVLLGLALASQLALGGSLGIALLGAARPDRGVGRYLTLPLTAIGLTLFGRFLTPGELPVAVALAVIAAGVLWMTLQVELAYARGERPKVMLDLLLAVVMFFGTAGIGPVIGDTLIRFALLGLLAFALAFRAAEARGAFGGSAVGQGALQAFMVIQIAVALELLELPGMIGPAIMLLAFYSWGGAADLLHGGVSARRVFIEYGILALFGFIFALIPWERI